MDCGLDNQLALVVSSAERVRRDEFNYRIRTMLLDSLPLPQISYTNCNIISGIIAATWYMVSLNILNCLRDVEEYMMDLAKVRNHSISPFHRTLYTYVGCRTCSHHSKLSDLSHK